MGPTQKLLLQFNFFNTCPVAHGLTTDYSTHHSPPAKPEFFLSLSTICILLRSDRLVRNAVVGVAVVKGRRKQTLETPEAELEGVIQTLLLRLFTLPRIWSGPQSRVDVRKQYRSNCYLSQCVVSTAGLPNYIIPAFFKFKLIILWGFIFYFFFKIYTNKAERSFGTIFFFFFFLGSLRKLRFNVKKIVFWLFFLLSCGVLFFLSFQFKQLFKFF